MSAGETNLYRTLISPRRTICDRRLFSFCFVVCIYLRKVFALGGALAQ